MAQWSCSQTNSEMLRLQFLIFSLTVFFAQYQNNESYQTGKKTLLNYRRWETRGPCTLSPVRLEIPARPPCPQRGTRPAGFREEREGMTPYQVKSDLSQRSIRNHDVSPITNPCNRAKRPEMNKTNVFAVDPFQKNKQSENKLQ